MRYTYLLGCVVMFILMTRPSWQANAAEETMIDDEQHTFYYEVDASIDRATVNGETIQLTDSSGREVAINTTVDGHTLAIQPVKPFINFWTYTLSITPDVKTVDGTSVVNERQTTTVTLQQPIDETSANIPAVDRDDYQGQALVTFSYDDGYANWMDYSLPLHQYYEFPGTYNIIGQYLYDEPNDTYMRPSAVWTADQLGMEIASHTQHHVFLPSLSDDDIRAEFEQSKEALAAIDIESTTLAIPFSAYDDRVRGIAKDYFDGVRVLNHDYNDVQQYDAHWLQSVAVTNTTTFDHIKKWVDGAIEDRAWLIIMWHDIYPDVDRTIVDDDAKERYDSTPLLLQQTMEYIQSKQKQQILPVSTAEGLSLTK